MRISGFDRDFAVRANESNPTNQAAEFTHSLRFDVESALHASGGTDDLSASKPTPFKGRAARTEGESTEVG